MKTRSLVMICLIAGLILLAGCSNSYDGYNNPPPPPSGGGCGVAAPAGESLDAEAINLAIQDKNNL